MLMVCFVGVCPAVAQPAAMPAPWHVSDLAVLVDPQGLETIESVSHPARAAEFKPVPNGFAEGYTRKVHWLRFSLSAPPTAQTNPVRVDGPDRPSGQFKDAAREGLLEIQPPTLDDLRLYVPSPGLTGQFDVWHTGDLLPYASREFQQRAFVHSISFTDDRPKTVYLRVHSNGTSLLLLRWWAPQRFAENSGREYGILGGVLGLLVASILINISYSWHTHDALYRRFMWLQAATLFLLLGVNGLVAEYLFVDSPWICDLWMRLSFPLQIYCSTRFYLLALQFDQGHPWIYRAMQGVAAVALVGLAFAAIGFFTELMQLLVPAGILALALGTYRSVQLLLLRSAGSTQLFISNLLRIAGTLSSLLAIQGLLPVDFVLMYGFQFGVIGSILVLRGLLTQRVRDVDEQRHRAYSEAQLAKAMAEKDRESMEQQRHFLAMLVHELKTPLSVIRLRLGAKEPSLRMQNHARNAVDEIDSLIDRSALVSQIEEQQLQPRLVTCNLADLLEQLAIQCDPAGRIVVASSLSAPEQVLHTDPVWLRMVLANLLDNALKYSPAHSTIDVTLQAQASDGKPGLQVSICNAQGAAGIPDAQRLFEKYYRAGGARAQIGSGLGLYIVKRLMAVLGGTITYHPQPSQITFSIWLSVAPNL